MTIAQSLFYVPPTGRWLARERRRLGLTAGEVARAVGGHPTTLSVLVRQNRVVPPGWTAALGALGLQVPPAPEPGAQPAYTGAQLHAEMRSKAHLRLTPTRLSHKLAIPEAELLALLGEERPVPSSWLAKLAELGLSVQVPGRPGARPEEKRESVGAEERRGLPGAAPKPGSRFAPYGPYAPLLEGIAGAPRVAGSESGSGPLPPPVRSRPPAKLYLHWSEEDGLHLTMSGTLMDQFPAALEPLLGFLRSGILLAPCISAGLPAAAPVVPRPPFRAPR